jgi:hypothetical protein
LGAIYTELIERRKIEMGDNDEKIIDHVELDEQRAAEGDENSPLSSERKPITAKELLAKGWEIT